MASFVRSIFARGRGSGQPAAARAPQPEPADDAHEAGAKRGTLAGAFATFVNESDYYERMFSKIYVLLLLCLFAYNLQRLQNKY